MISTYLSAYTCIGRVDYAYSSHEASIKIAIDCMRKRELNSFEKRNSNFLFLFSSISTQISKMNLYTIFFSTADIPFLGRVDKASLSTQTLIELFNKGIENLEVICGSTEEPADIGEWRSITYLQEQPVDRVEKQTNIYWHILNLWGTIDCNGCHQLFCRSLSMIAA